MNDIKLLLSLIFLLPILLVKNTFAQSPVKTIDITLGEWQPVVSSGLDSYGATAELVSVILEEMGYHANYLFMPWGRAESSVSNNEKDQGPRATFPFLKTAKRAARFIFSKQPVFSACMVFFYNREKITKDQQPLTTRQLSDIDRYRIGYVSASGGYQYPDQLKRILASKGTSFDSLYRVFQKLIDPNDDSVQVVPAVEAVGRELLMDLFPSDRFAIAILNESITSKEERCLLPVDYYFIMAKRNPNNTEFMNRFDKVHGQIDEGVLARIKQRAIEQPSNHNPEVILQLTPQSESINAQVQNGEYVLIPRNTRGLLMHWAERSDKGNRAKVLVTNGPLRGKYVLVPQKFIVLSDVMRD